MVHHPLFSSEPGRSSTVYKETFDELVSELRGKLSQIGFLAKQTDQSGKELCCRAPGITVLRKHRASGTNSPGNVKLPEHKFWERTAPEINKSNIASGK